MTAPTWLDELALEPGPPWLAMGTRGLGDQPWLLVDHDRDRDLAWKAALLAERHHEVFAALDTREVQAASDETLHLVRLHAAVPSNHHANRGVMIAGTSDHHTPVAGGTGGQVGADAGALDGLHPLDAAGRLVQEDLCLLVLRDGAPHLDAASLCFPSYWRLADKLGRPMAEVHGPVAHYAEELAARVDAFLARLRPDRPVWRRNWSIHDDPTYFLPIDPGGSGQEASPSDAPCPEPPEGLWLRSERQTLRRLTAADAVLFTIRTQQVPLGLLAERPDLARRMAAAVDAWSPELRAYKGGHGALAAVPWLASR